MWAVLEVVLEFLDLDIYPGRVTVAQRYEMKRRVRELRRKEAERAQKASAAGDEPRD
jgi:hypothetical protein